MGDPLQKIFGFRDDPVVPWNTIKTAFEVVDAALREPWRWRREGCNAQLGEWLADARRQLETTKRLVIAEGAPVTWIQYAEAHEPGRGMGCGVPRSPSPEERYSRRNLAVA